MTFKFIQFIHNYTILDYFYAQKVLKLTCLLNSILFSFIPLQTYKVSANKDSSDIVCPHCAAKKTFHKSFFYLIKKLTFNYNYFSHLYNCIILRVNIQLF